MVIIGCNICKLNCILGLLNFKTLWPIFMDGVQLPQGYIEPLGGDSLLFTIQFPGVLGAYLVDLGRMKG